jgi:hypothetical protein
MVEYIDSEKKIKFILSICILILLIVSFSILYTTYQSIAESTQEKQIFQNKLDEYKQELANVNSEIYYIKNELINTRNTLNVTYDEVELRRSDGFFEMYNPTRQEAISFIMTDRTSSKRYDDETFNCAHFSFEVKNNAEIEGIRCAYVFVALRGGVGHALVVFNTTDRGLLFIEPQSNEIVNLEVGKDYWADCVVVRSRRYYYPRNRDNIVEGFELFW